MDKSILTVALRFLIAITLLVFVGSSASAESKQEIGQRVLDNAEKLSDIRAEGAPAFRMEGKFRITSKSPSQQTEGKYSEIWASKAKWRREVQTPSVHRLEVGVSPTLSSYLDSGIDRPDPLSDRMLLRFPQSSPEIKGISEREISAAKASCVEWKDQGAKNFDCVDLATGVFLFRKLDYGPSSETCSYTNYQKFGERSFPRSVHCTEKRGYDIELTISSLTSEASPDGSLFVKPPGAIDVGDNKNCHGHRVTPPKLTFDLEPKYPASGRDDVTVVVTTVVGVDGAPQDLYVTNHAGSAFDQAALDAVRRWRFQPAVCDGTAIPVVISIQINFRKP